MRPSIEPDRSIDGPQPLEMKRVDLPGDGVNLFRDSKLGRATPDVVRAVRPALPLRQCLNRGHPRVTPHTRFVVDRYTRVVADFGAGNAFGLILVENRLPLA